MSEVKPEHALASCAPILRILGGYRDSQILNAALEYDVFTHIANGLHAVADIVDQTGANARAMAILLDGLVALNLLKKENGNYHLVDLSETFLVRGRPEFVGDFRYTALAPWDGIAHLVEVMKTGKPVKDLHLDSPEHPLWEKLVLGLVPFVRPSAQYLCKIMEDNDTPPGIRVLDIAGGSGIFAATLLKHDPTIQFTHLDSPQINQVARRFLAEEGIDVSAVRFMDADLRFTPLPRDSFDLVIISNICHHEDGPGNIALFRKAFDALVSGGQVVIHDFVVNNNRTGPPFPLLFAVYMLAINPRGGSYSFEEYKVWLREANFKTPTLHTQIPRIYEGPAIIIARKPQRK
jgi:ubiquinone/menaquinone biosynthesis C-methylase UbiE